MQNNTFVSVVAVVNSCEMSDLEQLVKLHERLSAEYVAFEIVVVENFYTASEKPSAIETFFERDCVGRLRLRGKTRSEIATYCGMEKSIGDFVATFIVRRDPLDGLFILINQAIRGQRPV